MAVLMIDNGAVRPATRAEREEQAAAPAAAPAQQSAPPATPSAVTVPFNYEAFRKQWERATRSPLTKEEEGVVALFYERYHDAAKKKATATEHNRIRTFTHEGRTYTLPRTVEIADDGSNGKIAYLALNKLQKDDKVVATGRSKRCKLSICLESWSLSARTTCRFTEESREELSFARGLPEKVGLPVQGYLTFRSKKPQQKCLGTSEKPVTLMDVHGGVAMLAVYTDYAPDGDLTTAYNSGLIGRMSPLQKVRLLRSGVRQLKTLHEMGIVHCDIKPENILIMEKEEGTYGCKLIDFGHKAKLGNKYTPNGGCLWGTTAYLPLESLGQNTETIDFARDVWGLGLTFYDCFSSVVQGEDAAFNKARQAPAKPDLMREILLRRREREQPTYTLLDWDSDGSIEGTLKSLLADMLSIERGDRPDVCAVLKLVEGLEKTVREEEERAHGTRNAGRTGS